MYLTEMGIPLLVSTRSIQALLQLKKKKKKDPQQQYTLELNQLV